MTGIADRVEVQLSGWWFTLVRGDGLAVSAPQLGRVRKLATSLGATVVETTPTAAGFPPAR